MRTDSASKSADKTMRSGSIDVPEVGMMRAAMRRRRRVLVFVGGALLLGTSGALSTDQPASDAGGLAAEITLTQKAAIEATQAIGAHTCVTQLPREEQRP